MKTDKTKIREATGWRVTLDVSKLQSVFLGQTVAQRSTSIRVAAPAVRNYGICAGHRKLHADGVVARATRDGTSEALGHRPNVTSRVRLSARS